MRACFHDALIANVQDAVAVLDGGQAAVSYTHLHQDGHRRADNEVKQVQDDGVLQRIDKVLIVECPGCNVRIICLIRSNSSRCTSEALFNNTTLQNSICWII